MKIDGGCHCGFITYEAEADPEKVSICHCTDCQRLSGSAFRASIPAPSDSFKNSLGTADRIRQDRRKRLEACAGLLPQMWLVDLRDRAGRWTEGLQSPSRD